MSGLARLYVHEGAEVSGSDSAKTDNTEALEASGVTVSYTQGPDNIASDLELVVYTDGVTEATVGWSELEAARAAGIKTVSYFEALAGVANEYFLIAVAGTHGKTTTTAMLIDILEEASFDPTAVVGSLRRKTGSNFRAGKSKYFVVEADEYMRHFLHLRPDVLLITNIDFDHPDYFKDLDDVQAAFRELVKLVPADGAVVAPVKDTHVQPVIKEAKCEVIDYTTELDLMLPLKQPGLHNRQNAAAAAAAAAWLGIEKALRTEALTHFTGTARRFEYKGDVHGAPVYDDYAHNPQKVAAAIAGAKELHKDKRLVVAFQPHTFSRTKALYGDFLEALSKADEVLLIPIYAAREADDGSVSSEHMAKDLESKGVNATHFFTHDALALHIRETVTSTDVVLCVGAGSVTEIATELTK